MQVKSHWNLCFVTKDLNILILYAQLFASVKSGHHLGSRREWLTCCGLNGVLSEWPLQDCFWKYFWNNIPIFLPLILDPGPEIRSLNALRCLTSFHVEAHGNWALPTWSAVFVCCSCAAAAWLELLLIQNPFSMLAGLEKTSWYGTLQRCGCAIVHNNDDICPCSLAYNARTLSWVRFCLWCVSVNLGTLTGKNNTDDF